MCNWDNSISLIRMSGVRGIFFAIKPTFNLKPWLLLWLCIKADSDNKVIDYFFTKKSLFNRQGSVKSASTIGD